MWCGRFVSYVCSIAYWTAEHIVLERVGASSVSYYRIAIELRSRSGRLCNHVSLQNEIIASGLKRYWNVWSIITAKARSLGGVIDCGVIYGLSVCTPVSHERVCITVPVWPRKVVHIVSRDLQTVSNYI